MSECKDAIGQTLEVGDEVVQVGTGYGSGLQLDLKAIVGFTAKRVKVAHKHVINGKEEIAVWTNTAEARLLVKVPHERH